MALIVHIVLTFTGVTWALIIVVKCVTIPVANYYYYLNEEHPANSPACSPENTAILPYIIGYPSVDIFISAVAMSLEV